MSKKTLKPISLAVGTAFITTLAAGSASAEVESNTNPFAMNELSTGYMQLAYGGGGGEKSDKEGSCGGKKSDKEGSCGGKKADKEGTCGGEKSEKEGKCGEGKCGSDMKKNMEGSCGNKKAEEEGKCGEGKCGSNK